MSITMRKKSGLRSVNTMSVMLARCSPISVQIRPSTPESLASVTSMRVVCSGWAGPSAQRRSIQRSLSSKASSSAQSMAWICTPLPRTAMPTIRSPGIGLQQGAGCATWPLPRPITTGASLSAFGSAASRNSSG